MGGRNIVFCYILLDCEMAWSKKEEKLVDLITKSKMQGKYEEKKKSNAILSTLVSNSNQDVMV